MTLLLDIEWTPESTTVGIIDVAARSNLAVASETHHPAGDGHDVDRWLRSTAVAARSALDSLAAFGLTSDDVRSVRVHTRSAGGLVALDDSGAPLHAAMLGTHTGSAPDADWLVANADGGADAWLAGTGVIPTAGTTVALLSYLHRTEPDAWNAMARCTLPIGLLAERMGADPSLSEHDAIGTAVADRRVPNAWCTDLLRVVDETRDWAATMPTIVDTATPVGVLDATVADALGVPAGKPLHIGPDPGA